MSMQFIKPDGPRFVASQTDTPLKKKDKVPWYAYFIGAAIYTALAGWLFAESSPLAWVCLISAPVGFFYAWGAWVETGQLNGQLVRSDGEVMDEEEG